MCKEQLDKLRKKGLLTETAYLKKLKELDEKLTKEVIENDEKLRNLFNANYCPDLFEGLLKSV